MLNPHSKIRASGAALAILFVIIGFAPLARAGSAPNFLTSSFGFFRSGVNNTVNIFTSGSPTPTITIGGVALPGGIAFTDNGDGTAKLTGIANFGTGGQYAITLTAANGNPPDAVQNFTLEIDEDPAVTNPLATTFTVGQAGSFDLTSRGFPKCAITLTGSAIPPNLAFVDTKNNKGTLSGTPAPGTGGTYTFTETASSSGGEGPPRNRVARLAGPGGDDVQTFVLTVNQAPVIVSGNTKTFATGVAGTFTAVATGFPSPAITVSGALPTGITFNPGNGTASFTGTPAAGTGGSYPLVLTATNAAGVATQNFTLIVNQPPAITSAANVTFTESTPGTFTVTTTGFPTPAIAQGGVALPAGVTFTDNGDGTGTLAGTPAASTAGTYAIVFNATNSGPPFGGSGAPPLQSATQNFFLTVNSVPTITSPNNATFVIGTPGFFIVSATGSPKPALTQTGALPTGVTFTDNLNGTATLSGTPAAGTGGTYPLVFTAANVAGSATQNFTLTIKQPPAITSPNTITFTETKVGTFTVTTTGFPAPALTQTGTLPAGVTFVDKGDGTATLSGTPAAGSKGTYSLVFTATNSAGPPNDGQPTNATATQNFTLIVNAAPAITSASSTTFVIGTAGTFTVTSTGSPVPTLARTGVALPAGVTFTPNEGGTGTLAGTPAAGTGGTYTFTFTATNTAGSATQTFTLTVNEAPAITSANSVTFTETKAGTFSVTSTGFPKPAVTRTGAALPAGVTFDPVTATLAGTPAAGTAGTYTFTFTATNGVGAPATQAFTLTVNAAPAITSANFVNFTIGVAGTFTVTTTGSPTAALARTGVALPSGVTFIDNGNGTGTLAGTPVAGSAGAYALTFTATNSVGSAVQSFTLNVLQPPAITSPNAVTFVVGTAGTFNVTTTGSPTPAIARTGATLPTGVTFVDNGNGTGTLAGTAAAGTAGTYALTFTATNSAGAPATQAFTLTVNLAPVITSANTVTFGVGTPGTFAVTTTGVPTPGIALSGVALPGGVTFVDNGNGTGTLSGTPALSAAGTYAIVFTATNSAGASTQNFSLVVNGAGSSNAPQLILSGPFATPNPALVDTMVNFLAVMSDPRVGSNWNFGDGSTGVIGGRGLSDSTAAHIYPVAGTYNVIVTAKDPVSGAVVSGNVVVQVVDSKVRPGTTGIRVMNSVITLDDAGGTIQLKAVIHMRKGVDLSQTGLVFHLNGLDEAFTFTADGNGTSPNGTAKMVFIKRAGNSPNQEARITMKITRSGMKELLAKNTTVDSSGLPIKGVYVFDFDGNSLSYIAKLKFVQKTSGVTAKTRFGHSE